MERYDKILVCMYYCETQAAANTPQFEAFMKAYTYYLFFGAGIDVDEIIKQTKKALHVNDIGI